MRFAITWGKSVWAPVYSVIENKVGWLTLIGFCGK